MGGQAYRWQTQQSGHTLEGRTGSGQAAPKLGEAGVSGGQPVKEEVGGVGVTTGAMHHQLFHKG